jgi:predicted DNA-binding transcriptional regulator AlpA
VNLPSNHIPALVDMNRLCAETCMCEDTIDALVLTGKLPPPKKLGRKRVWLWSEVLAYIGNGGPPSQDDEGDAADHIIARTQAALARRRKVIRGKNKNV